MRTRYCFLITVSYKILKRHEILLSKYIPTYNHFRRILSFRFNDSLNHNFPLNVNHLLKNLLLNFHLLCKVVFKVTQYSLTI